MEESLQVKLAKSNINITEIADNHILFEFPYHPRPGEVRWCKSFILGKPGAAFPEIIDTALDIRKALER